MRRNLFVLFVAFFASVLGVQFPAWAPPLAIIPTISMIVQLFFCFLSTADPATPLPMAALRTLPKFLGIKMLIVPLICWAAARMLFPEYALGALMVSGASIGVTGPFFAFLCGAEPFFVIGGVIASSFLLPVTIPLLAALVLSVDGGSIDGLMAACLGSAFFLAYCMLIPFLTSKFLWKYKPQIAQGLLDRRFWITLVCIAGANFVIFGRYSAPLLGNPAAMADAFLTALLTTAVMLGLGMIMVRAMPTRDALSRIIGISCVNCALMIIVSAEFFSLNEVLVCTLHTLMLMSMGVPYELCRKWLLARDARLAAKTNAPEIVRPKPMRESQETE